MSILSNVGLDPWENLDKNVIPYLKREKAVLETYTYVRERYQDYFANWKDGERRLGFEFSKLHLGYEVTPFHVTMINDDIYRDFSREAIKEAYDFVMDLPDNPTIKKAKVLLEKMVERNKHAMPILSNQYFARLLVGRKTLNDTICNDFLDPLDTDYTTPIGELYPVSIPAELDQLEKEVLDFSAPIQKEIDRLKELIKEVSEKYEEH